MRATVSRSAAVKHLAMALGLLLSTSATAQDANPFVKYVRPWGEKTPDYAWQGEDDSHTWIYKKDVIRQNSEVTVWVYSSSRTPKPDGTSFTLTRTTFDCAGRLRYSAQTSYDTSDKVIQQIDRVADWTYIRPDTVNDDIQKKLCPQTK
jgi:hypothetical protein